MNNLTLKFFRGSTILIMLIAILFFLRIEWDGLYFRTFFFLVIFIGFSAASYYLYNSRLPAIVRLHSYIERPVTRFMLVAIISSGVFFVLPGFLFDDAGFVLRYLDNFGKGYLFRFNTADEPVYGISGFIHGLYSGILCYLHLAKPEMALRISNYTGFIFTSWFIYLIFRHLVQVRWVAIICWIISLTASRMYLNVAACGLETALHLSFVMGAVYFFLVKKTRLFFLFSALMILSKLDAVPVAAICLGLHGIFVLRDRKNIKIKKEIIDFCIWFLVPFTAGMAVIIWLFGSPLPQSAYSKLYYHSHPHDHWFPFLQYFLVNVLRLLILRLVLFFCILHYVEAIVKRNVLLVTHSIFGTLFLAVMALYYFYNPGERMMWYYAMPELFMIMQIVYSIYYFNYTYGSPRYRLAFLLIFFAFFSNVVWKSALEAKNWLQASVGMVEAERYRLGGHIGSLSSASDVLLSGHGLPARWFKGYVIDISGLNSRLATRYHLNADSIIADFHPDYIVNHAYGNFVEIYNRYNYELAGVYRDITLRAYPSWILLKKSSDAQKHVLHWVDGSLNQQYFIRRDPMSYLQSKNKKLSVTDTLDAAEKILHAGIQRQPADITIGYTVFGNGMEIMQKIFTVGKIDLNSADVSHYTYDIEVDVTQADSVVFVMEDRDFELIEPFYEVTEK